jgi:hypothetical protein
MSNNQKGSKLAQKIENARHREEVLRKEREKDLLSKFKEAEKKRMRSKKMKLDEERAHIKHMYEEDQKKYFEQRNMSVTRKKQEDEEVESKLREFDRSMEVRKINKENGLMSISKKAESHMNKVMDRLDQIKSKNPEDEMDYNELAKTFKKKIDAAKNRDRQLKHMASKKSSTLREQQQRAKMLLQSENRKNVDRQKYIMQRLRQKESMLKDKDKMTEEQFMQRKEIQRLRRENQLFNFQREKMLSQDYKKRLMDKLQDKAFKAEKIKERSKTAASTSGFLNMTVM